MTARLGLGTVQFGLDYGISNMEGRTPITEVATILADARAASVNVLDTAAMYGNSEKILGTCDLRGFRVITKTPRFGNAIITETDAEELTRAFRRSLENLRLDSIEGLLVHHAEHLLLEGGNLLWHAMRELKDRGLVQSIGVSIYDSAQLDAVLEAYHPDVVQLPVNVLDQRLIEGGKLDILRRRGVEVHARSVFLQGLLLMEPDRTPDYFSPFRPLLRRWHQAARDQGLTTVQAALAFVRDLPGIDVVLVGVNNRAQFGKCCLDFSCAGNFDAGGLACDDPALLNPSRWQLD